MCHTVDRGQACISIHALLAESDNRRPNHIKRDENFYPRSPCGERLNCMTHTQKFCAYFYPRSPCGERQHAYQLVLWVLRFLSTLSLRRATVNKRCELSGDNRFLSTLSLRRATVSLMLYDTSSLIFLSTLSLRRATLFALLCNLLHDDFYPRSPCGERRVCLKLLAMLTLISIHALLAESDKPTLLIRLCLGTFLSTLSLRRATGIGDIINNVIDHFYPRSPCGERRAVLELQCVLGNFYPRSPCGERRHFGFLWPSRLRFLSTLSLRRATKIDPDQVPGYTISIHALLAESDLNLPSSPILRNISIHALLAESDGGGLSNCFVKIIFLSTLSLRRATRQRLIELWKLRFLSTLSLRRATAAVCQIVSSKLYFYPRSPCGERRRAKSILAEIGNFYPRSPCGERPAFWFFVALKAPISIHALLAESDNADCNYRSGRPDFYPRSPCGERP